RLLLLLLGVVLPRLPAVRPVARLRPVGDPPAGDPVRSPPLGQAARRVRRLLRRGHRARPSRPPRPLVSAMLRAALGGGEYDGSGGTHCGGMAPAVGVRSWGSNGCEVSKSRNARRARESVLPLRW